ncbi:MAG: endopeptidase, partial [Mycobacterium sp.]|nr:endopeptidase [Mycobacterium sp.]
MGLGLHRERWSARVASRFAIGAVAGLIALPGLLSSGAVGSVLADPSDDGMAKLTELSRQAEQTTEAMHSAQIDLNDKLAAEHAADSKHVEDLAAVNDAKSRLATFQSGVDKFAAAMYMGGRTDGMGAILTAESPQQLIGRLAVQRVISTEMLAQMADYRATREQAAQAEQASAKSAADAKTAAEQAAGVRANLQSKQSQLQSQIAVVKSQYQALSPG